MAATHPAVSRIAAIAAILDEELAIFRRLEALADAQQAAIRDDDFARLNAIVAEQLALADELAAREAARLDLVPPGSTLSELIDAWGEPAALLRDRREALTAQIDRVRLAHERNSAIITTMLGHYRDRVQLALQERALYGEDGQPRPAALRGVVDRRA
ncbi:MAG: hypothetical protein KatS3mg060_2609 [Dehalococcoidia bacterium]|nr:MAG: hypothetical protein KatS3mg060_2609 [Dehalococcoidia bacterium]